MDESELQNVLKTPLSELVQSKQQKIILLHHNDTVADALKTLAGQTILSAPLVMMPDIEDSGDVNLSPQLLGWIDVQDILKSFLDHLRGCGRDIPVQRMLSLMSALEEEGPRFSGKTLITLRSSDDRGLMYQADSETTSVITAIRDLFLQRSPAGETKVTHRIALFDAHGEVTAIISQMDVARWLVSKEGVIGAMGHKTIEELGLLTGKPPVITVNPHSPTLMAYDLMARNGVSGAPVVTDEGELIANLSTSDLRALTSEHFGVLALPVAEFLALEHQTAYIGYSVKSSDHTTHPFFASSRRPGGSKKTDINLYTVQRNATLLQTLHAFVDEHVHRLYVVQSGIHVLRVEAVLTLTDVLRLLAGVW